MLNLVIIKLMKVQHVQYKVQGTLTFKKMETK